MDDNTVNEMREPGSVLGAALSYMERGWWVFPAFVVWNETTRKKEPTFPGSWDAASSSDPAMAHAWFGPGGLYSQPGHGVVCIDAGRSGLVVVDIDAGGMGAWQAFRLRHRDCPETYRVATPGGGEHWFYAARPSEPVTIDSSGKVARHVDVRGKGGLVFAAPSHIQGYGTYRWLEGDPVGGSADCPFVPRSVIEAMTAGRPLGGVPFSQVGDGGGATASHMINSGIPGIGAAPRLFPGPAAAWEFVRPRAEAFGSLNPGQGGLGRNQALFELALMMAHFVGVFWSQESALAKLHELATRNGMVASHGWHAVDATIRSAWSRPLDWQAVDSSAMRGDPGGYVPPSQPGDAEQGAPGPAQEDAGAAVALAKALVLPEEFWAARSVLGHIRQAAHSRGRSGDVAFHAVLARVSAFHPPGETLDTGLGSPASLNWYAAIVGPSAAGKSTGVKVAATLIRAPDMDYADPRPLGTGEGLAEAFMGIVEEEQEPGASGRPKAPKKNRKQVRHNALVIADEGEALTKISERNSATIGPALRSGWVGEVLGQQNGTAETTRIVREYSLGVIVGFQPETALPVLADAATGMPQRFAWVWAVDPSRPRVRPEHPGMLAWVPRVKQAAAPAESAVADPLAGLSGVTGTWSGEPWCAPEPMTLAAGPCEELEERDYRASALGDTPVEMDGHEPLFRIKVSALLALLEGRGHVSEEDWALSAIVWATSCRVRDYLIQRGRDAAAARVQAQRDEHGHRASVAEAAAHSVREGREAAHFQTLVVWVIDRVTKRGPQTYGALRKALDSPRRRVLDAAVDNAVDNGVLVVEGSVVRRVEP